MCSVDYVSHAIVTASKDPASLGRCFHIWQPRAYVWREKSPRKTLPRS